MTTQRVTDEVPLQMIMSTKATAFTIDELLRPDLHTSANQGILTVKIMQDSIMVSN